MQYSPRGGRMVNRITMLMLIVTNDNDVDSYDGSNVNCYGWIRMSSPSSECVARS